MTAPERAAPARDPLALLDALAAVAAERPDAPAIVDAGDGRVTTRGALVARARGVADGLRAAGLRAGDRVLFAVRPSAEAVAAILGIVAAGGVVVAVDLGGGDALFADRMRLARPRWVLAESVLLAAGTSRLARRLLARRGVSLPDLACVRDARWLRVGPPLPGAWRARALDALVRDGARVGHGDAPPTPVGQRAPHASAGSDVEKSVERRVDKSRAAPNPTAAFDACVTAHTAHASNRGGHAPEDEALVVFTSGTTGAPRAVVHARRSLAATLDLVARLLAPAPGDVVYARELHLIVPALLAGAVAVVPRDVRFDAGRTAAELARHGVTHAFLVTADAQALVAHARRVGAPPFPRGFRRLLLGAAPVHAAFLARLRDALPPDATATAVYGLTEMLPVAAASLDEKVAWCGDGDLLGAPVPGVDARLAGDGELVLRGPHLCAGYLGEPPLEALHTGDLARMEPDGRLVLLGRAKEMIIRGRHNVYPALHEPLVARLPGVRRCAMVGVWDAAAQDERIVLVVEPDDASDGDALAGRVAAALRTGDTRLDDAALPDHVLVGAIPEAGRSRKPDRAALRAWAAAALGRTGDGTAPGTARPATDADAPGKER